MTIPAEIKEPYQNYHRAADLVHEMRMVVYAAEANLLDAKDALDFEEARLTLLAEGKNAEERRANLTLLTERTRTGTRRAVSSRSAARNSHRHRPTSSAR